MISGARHSAAAALLFVSPKILACASCRPQVEESVYTPHFWSTLLNLLLPLCILVLATFAIGKLHRPVQRSPGTHE